MHGNFLAILAAAEFRDPFLPLWAMELLANVFLWLWLFCMGATVGSFLNVVVYRLPRGLNIVYPGSCCPHCGHAIRLQDNIPLLSWLNLRGRCRDCGGRISPRYFLVEQTVAVAFLVVLAVEYYLPAGAMRFPTRHLLHVRDGAPFWCMYFLHVSLVTTVMGAFLLRSDGNQVPATLFLPAIIAGLVLPLVWPNVRSLPAAGHLNFPGWQLGLIDGLAGLSGGLVVAAFLSPFARRRGWGLAAVLGFCCAIAIVLGWQRGIVAAAVAWPLGELIAGMLARIATRREDLCEAPAQPLATPESSAADTPLPPQQTQVP